MLKYFFNLNQFICGPRDWDMVDLKASTHFCNLDKLDNNLSNNSNYTLQDFITKTNESVTNNISPIDLNHIHCVSPEMINYAGITILGCVVAITSALIILYMNHLMIYKSEKHIQSLSPFTLKLYNLYKNSLNITSITLKVFIAAFYLLMVSTCCYMITL